MALASKIAKAVTKKTKPVEQEALMVRKKEDELYKIMDKHSEDTYKGMAARNEISRRRELDWYKKETPDWKEKPIPTDLGPNWYKERDKENMAKGGKENMAKGGMVTKKKAPAKAKAPATASRSHPLNKFYGK